MRILTTIIERHRLRLHFALVRAEMRRAPAPAGADPARRAETLRTLARYARAGAFPRHGGRGAPRPVFIDADGNRCAMAHLLERRGHGNAVHGIAAARNHAYVAELARDPQVAAAIHGLGISEAEAARIQPCYNASALQCLAAFALQWAGVASALWLGARAVRRIRASNEARASSGPRWRRIAAPALAVLLILAGVASWGTTTTAPAPSEGGMSFCGAGPDYGVCGSAFSVPGVVRQIRALRADS
ncbi:hypothetical protein [Longimicrobium sp.]|uniref:hypothetical protein n=1 Tax=Longimicrobium sp. TaxID=2029185 RepID=UPI002E37C198|nr:hypothetical protein [Longimicrobium sp.]HEX6039196.1 hypothetical protein [Longimicrobium sp.]